MKEEKKNKKELIYNSRNRRRVSWMDHNLYISEKEQRAWNSAEKAAAPNWPEEATAEKEASLPGRVLTSPKLHPGKYADSRSETGSAIRVIKEGTSSKQLYGDLDTHCPTCIHLVTY